MKKTLCLIALLYFAVIAQNAAVSSYLNPRTSGNADIRIREVRVPSSGQTINTYWCTLGYNTTGGTHGYGGIQYTSDYSKGPKNYIYSQWNDYSTSAYNDPNTHVETFGGEGTGVKSMNNDPANQWDPDYWHVTADRVWNEGNNTYFAYFLRNGKTGVWRHIMTWSTPESNLRFRSSYCFLEDWWGRGEYREGHMRKGWNRVSSNQNWQPITSYSYSINGRDIAPGGRSYNKRTNWCGGKKQDATGEYFFMGAGGNVASTNNNGSSYTIVRTETAPQEEYGVIGISGLTVTPSSDNSQLEVQWSNDRTTVPQFAYYITIKDGNTTVLFVSDTIPEKRNETIDISSLSLNSKSYTLTLDLLDMFDGNSESKTVTFGDGVANKSLIGFNIKKLTATLTGNTIKFNQNFHTPIEFSLYNSNGQLILKEMVSEQIHELRNKISKGSYIWKITNNEITTKGSFVVLK